jgi:hypothetical protein
MSSWSFGTLASLARLPINDVVVRSRTKFGDMLSVRTGGWELGVGGITDIWWFIRMKTQL